MNFNYEKYEQLVSNLKDEFAKKVQENYSKNEQKIIFKALDYAEIAHKDQFRKSGEPYIIHPIYTSMKLIEWKMDYESVAAGLLHDVIEDTDRTYQDLLTAFNFNISDIVQTVSKVTQYSKKQRVEIQKHHLDNLYIVKVFLSLSKDMRAIIVKLADRMHNMETIHALKIEKQQLIARETLDIYASIAGRMGMYSIKTKLQDICFRILDPYNYSLIHKRVQKLLSKAEETLDKTKLQISKLLDSEGIEHKLFYRIKGIYSIWQKTEKGYLPENIHDIFAMRVIVKNEMDCYKILGLIHLNFIYIKNAFKDFISSPKWNLYRSIHTTIIINSVLIEFQIRTENMHNVSEMGLAAHWKYKEKNDYLQVSKTLIDEFLQGRDASIDVIKQISKTDLFDVLVTNDNQLYVSSNQTTALDLAFRFDPKKLEYLSKVFINGESVSLDTRIKKGDVVQFAFSNNMKIQKDWMQASENSNVINHIKEIFNKKYIEMKHTEDTFLESVEKYLNSNGINQKEYKKRLSYLGYKELVDFLTDIYKTEISKEDLYNFFSTQEAVWKNSFKVIKKLLSYRIFLDTYFVPPQGIMPSKLVITECCSKFPKIHLIGILKNNILKVHRFDCPKSNTNQGKRLVIEWDEKALLSKPRLFKVNLKFYGKMTETIGNQIIQSMLQQKVLILKIDIERAIDNVNFKATSIIRVKDEVQIKRLINNLKLQGFVKEIEII